MDSHSGTEAADNVHAPIPDTLITHVPDTHATASGPAPQANQRPPSPPPTVLQQKRPLPGGKKAHTFVNGGKSSRVGEAHQRKSAPHLRLQDPAYQARETRNLQDNARPTPGPKPRGPRQTRPLPKLPRTLSLLGKEPSFTVRHPQPSRPHGATIPPPARKQEPSFQVRSQSPSRPSSSTLDALQQQRIEEEAQRLAYEQALRAHADEQARQRQAFEQQQQAERGAYERALQAQADEQARQRQAYEQARQAQADEQARRATDGQASQAQVDEQARQLEAYEQARAQADEHARQRQTHEQAQVRADEQARQAAERQARQARADEQARQAYEHAQADERVRQAGEEQEQADSDEWRVQLREQQERQLREYEEAYQAHQQQVQDCKQMKQPYLGTSDQEDDMEVDAVLGVTTTEHSILEDSTSPLPAPLPETDATQSLLDPALPLPDAPSTSPLSAPLPKTDATQSLLDPALPLPDLFDYQPPVAKPTTAPIWNPPEQVPFRVPSPTFPTPVQAVAPAQDLASAQLVSLLLDHGQQMMTLMQAMIVENRELKSLLVHEFVEIKSQLQVVGQGSTDRAMPKDADDIPEEDIDMEDLGREADDELPAKRRSRKQKQPSIFDDPLLKPSIKNLQECTKEHLFLLCKAKTAKELIKNNPPITDEEMQSFLDGDDDLLTCSVQSFRIDFIRPWKENQFNQVAKSVFAKSFLAMYKSGAYAKHGDVPTKLLTEKIVGSVLDRQMDYRRRQYREHANPLSQADIDRIKKRKAMNARRATLRDGRVWVVIEFNLTRHKRLFVLLRPVHMSGDETDGPVKTHPPTFRIVEASWQSLAFKTFMRALDALYREHWAHPVGDRATPGNPPRIRVDRPESSRVEDGIAPVGLWKNCYDKKWLESLRPHVRESLQIIDADYDFTLPEPRVLQKY